MRVPKMFILAPILTILIVSCRKSSPVEPQQQPDTNWVTQPQIDIPWPGLANSSWPMFMHDPQHTGRSPYRGPQAGQMEWRFDAGYLVYSSPAIGGDGNIYFACLQNAFFAVAPSGSEAWHRVGGWGDCSPLVGSDGTIYVAGHGTSPELAYLYAYDPSGDLKWQVPIVGVVSNSAPVISKDGGTIYVPQGRLYAIRKTGSVVWSLLPDSAEMLMNQPAFSVDGSTLYIPGKAALYAIDTSGSLKWKCAGSPSSPSVDNAGNIYFSSNNNMYSLNPDGSLRWSVDVPSNGPFEGPAIGSDGTVYFAGEYLYAIDYAGKLRWKYDLSVPGSASMPAIDIDGTIYFGKATDRLPTDTVNFVALNSNGTVKFRASLKSPDGTVPDIDSSPAISSEGKIYVGCDYPHGAHVYKIK